MSLTKAQMFRISPAQDASSCAWVRDIAVGQYRALRLSVSHYSRDDDRGGEHKSVATWIHLKLFKQLEPQCYPLDDKEHGLRKIQQISLRPVEIDRILQSLEDLRMHLLTSMYIKHEHLIVEPSEYFNISEYDDSLRCHWFGDIHESWRRKVRIAYVIYNTKDPLKTTYVQFKLFTRKSLDEVFTRHAQVSLTLGEFRELSNQSADLMTSIKDAVYGQ